MALWGRSDSILTNTPIGLLTLVLARDKLIEVLCCLGHKVASLSVKRAALAVDPTTIGTVKTRPHSPDFGLEPQGRSEQILAVLAVQKRWVRIKYDLSAHACYQLIQPPIVKGRRGSDLLGHAFDQRLGHGVQHDRISRCDIAVQGMGKGWGHSGNSG